MLNTYNVRALLISTIGIVYQKQQLFNFKETANILESRRITLTHFNFLKHSMNGFISLGEQQSLMLNIDQR